MKTAARLLLTTVLALSAACIKNVNEADYSDSGIKERLETQLRAKKGLDLSHLSIDVHSGVVTVSGVMPTYEERDAVADVAKKITGVDQVIVNIIVQE